MKKVIDVIVFGIVICMCLLSIVPVQASTDYSLCYHTGCNNKKTCTKSGCSKSKASGSAYCYTHTCLKVGCNNGVVANGIYCSTHNKTTKTGTSTQAKKKTSTNRYDDPYDVHSYIDADDFADDWEEEFEDWDDAWDYYEENY